MFDQELRAIEEELAREKADAWPEAPPIQTHLGELRRKIQDLKKALYNGEVSVIAAKEQLPYILQVAWQLQRVEGELEALLPRRPLLRQSLQILRSSLRHLDELRRDLRAYLDLHSCKDPALEELRERWARAKGRAERRRIREEIRGRVDALIEEGCRRSREEDSALAEASRKLSLEALALELTEA